MGGGVGDIYRKDNPRYILKLAGSQLYSLTRCTGLLIQPLPQLVKVFVQQK